MREKPGPKKQEILERLGKRKKEEEKETMPPDRSEELITEGARLMKQRDISARNLKELSDTNFPGSKFAQSEIEGINEELGLIFKELFRLGVDNKKAIEAIKRRCDEENAHINENERPRSSRR